jgi:hypothetical protein
VPVKSIVEIEVWHVSNRALKYYKLLKKSLLKLKQGQNKSLVFKNSSMPKES